jgi:hypothetical protein
MPFSFDERILVTIAQAIKKMKLKAVVIGNTASILHGAPVLTQDVDLLFAAALSRKKLDCFAGLVGATDIKILSEMPGERGLPGKYTAQRLLGGPVPIDMMYERAGGIPFATIQKNAGVHDIGLGQALVVASLEDVITTKEHTNRPKDVASLPILRDTLAAQRELKKHPRP